MKPNCLTFLYLLVIAAGTLAAQPSGGGRLDRALTAPQQTLPGLNASAPNPNPTAIQVPVLGFLASRSSADVRPIVGAPGAVVLGSPIPLPSGLERLIPVPGQSYGIAESLGSGALAVLPLGAGNTGTPLAIPGTLAGADRFAFSPNGTAALFYASAAQQAEVVSGLPANPTLVQTLDLSSLGAPLSAMAVSDDAQTVLAGASGSVWAFRGNQPGESLVTAGFPSAVRFFPGTSDAVIADSQRQQVGLLTGIGQQFNFRVLAGAAQGLSGPSDVEISSDGLRVLVASAAGLASIDLASGAVTAAASPFLQAKLERLVAGYLVTSGDGASAGVWLGDASATPVWSLQQKQKGRN